jgi:hypothetical protein
MPKLFPRSHLDPEGAIIAKYVDHYFMVVSTDCIRGGIYVTCRRHPSDISQTRSQLPQPQYGSPLPTPHTPLSGRGRASSRGGLGESSSVSRPPPCHMISLLSVLRPCAAVMMNFTRPSLSCATAHVPAYHTANTRLLGYGGGGPPTGSAGAGRLSRQPSLSSGNVNSNSNSSSNISGAMTALEMPPVPSLQSSTSSTGTSRKYSLSSMLPHMDLCSGVIAPSSSTTTTAHPKPPLQIQPSTSTSRLNNPISYSHTPLHAHFNSRLRSSSYLNSSEHPPQGDSSASASASASAIAIGNGLDLTKSDILLDDAWIESHLDAIKSLLEYSFPQIKKTRSVTRASSHLTLSSSAPPTSSAATALPLNSNSINNSNNHNHESTANPPPPSSLPLPLPLPPSELNERAPLKRAGVQCLPILHHSRASSGIHLIAPLQGSLHSYPSGSFVSLAEGTQHNMTTMNPNLATPSATSNHYNNHNHNHGNGNGNGNGNGTTNRLVDPNNPPNRDTGPLGIPPPSRVFLVGIALSRKGGGSSHAHLASEYTDDGGRQLSECVKRIGQCLCGEDVFAQMTKADVC